ncbi:hypothetical protein CYMTET_10061 [Cymbomonas tetramitiformis]|uniref:Uncharacterized protein n=1 Tax=Cymbomonas tetramitiformis TaxID=36881 RepID=A0AAE0GPX1_9CHLO|nr:hypothetical protein CYMTET_10061 [Cymbomonas tetramitiformis]
MLSADIELEKEPTSVSLVSALTEYNHKHTNALGPVLRSSSGMAVARWKQLGQHRKYFDGKPRPLMRGWLHGVCVLVWFLSRDQLGLSANADTLASYVVFVYFFSALYHLVPWSHPLSYETAMFLDFVGIQVAYIGHIATWAGWTSWLAMASQFVACIVFAIGPTVLLGKASSANTTVMECGRRRRLYGTLVQQAMLCYAEICYMKHGVFLTLGIVGKFLFPLYFRHYAAYDAKRQGPLVWPGVWSPHENFHASTLIVHILGILGMAHAESLQSPSQ